MGIFKKETKVEEQKCECNVIERPKRMVVRLFKIKTYYNMIVEGKNKRFRKDFIIVGRSKKDALVRFYNEYSDKPQYVVKEICPAEYVGK